MKSKSTLSFACLVLAGVVFVFEDTGDSSRLETATQSVIASRSTSDGNDGPSTATRPVTRAAVAQSNEINETASAADHSWYDAADPTVEPDDTESQVAEPTDAGTEPLIDDYDAGGQALVGSTSAAAFAPAPTIDAGKHS
ncbi:hypothetical protein [Aurantiacibacter zhengii]|uniref:Secreted protein n=1 Tax=Aurantiacibacter zhengii TaxID=2307003 RepID=A0A418NMJ0_9SPHN|nr:hypothetical protein [Aurantiacibacter zhengii]RIV82223.1 hypothetical protein D2V07_18215 [Aurantiacibacter zhengii]